MKGFAQTLTEVASKTRPLTPSVDTAWWIRLPRYLRPTNLEGFLRELRSDCVIITAFLTDRRGFAL